MRFIKIALPSLVSVVIAACGGGGGGGSGSGSGADSPLISGGSEDVVVSVTGNIIHGSISPSQNQAVEAGEQVVFTVMPDNGYRLEISGCGGTLLGDIYTTAAVDENCSISVSFTPWVIGERYQVFGNGNIIRDLVNGLEWMRCSGGMSWDSELQTCSGTTYSYTYTSAGSFVGPSGFRMPTKDELKSLVYCSSGTPSEYDISTGAYCTGVYDSPAIYASAFPETSAGSFWSSDSSVVGERDMVNFSNGYEYSSAETSYGRVRLVRRVDEITGNSHGFPADFPVIIDNGGLGKETFLTGNGGVLSQTREQHRQVVADSGLRPIIHIHGSGGHAYKSGWSGKEFYDYLKSQYGYEDSHIWAVSYLGMDNSTTQRGCTTYARNVEDVRRFIDSVMEYLDVDKVDIIGHSLGAAMIRSYINGLVYNDERLNTETAFSETLYRSNKIGTAVLLAGLNRGGGTYPDSVHGCENAHIQNGSTFITGSEEIEASNGVNYVSAYSSYDRLEYLYKDEFWSSGLGADPGAVFHEYYSYHNGGGAAPETKSPNYLSESTANYTGNLPASIAARNFGIDELGLRSLYDSDNPYLPMWAHMRMASELDVVEWFAPYLNQ